ncbi:MAG: hypothetical protein MK289_23320 [Trichodesmium sp. ALOHA_ZT_67]|uniref:hypothetical protein n=1 Tax=Trichodesmium erythraeum TaxID=1206 RepID=UPI0000393085|nr:hypothetical protein [Trichodesmium erythraeum GBRTRLIN201]MCH2051268.1 hypothetical protein [Trichodesmium sp. ALOHA_ZT_67]MDT9341423.1 hypothetical protein [Trichodesmium erythraeum 21-75]
MTYIGTREAAFLLGICCQRVRALLSQGRIKDAYKDNGLWQIPLYGKMPIVIPGKRGPKGVWCHHKRKHPTKIHVNQHFIKVNAKRINEDPLMTPDQLIPVITLKQTNRNDMGYQMVLDGQCRIVYKPYEPLPCGAHLWIETYKPVQFVDTRFKPRSARRPYKDIC